MYEWITVAAVDIWSHSVQSIDNDKEEKAGVKTTWYYGIIVCSYWNYWHHVVREPFVVVVVVGGVADSSGGDDFFTQQDIGGFPNSQRPCLMRDFSTP